MFGIGSVASHPNAIIRDANSIVPRNFALAPFKVKDVVGDIGPVLAHIFRVVQLLVDSAGLIDELSAGCPRSSKGPRALCRVENELLDTFS